MSNTITTNKVSFVSILSGICKKGLLATLMVVCVSSNAHAGNWGWKLGLAAAAGVAVVLTGGLASPFVAMGTASIGGMVGGAAGLSGAAATSAGLAALGGGSVATGAGIVTSGIVASGAAGSSLLLDGLSKDAKDAGKGDLSGKQYTDSDK